MTEIKTYGLNEEIYGHTYNYWTDRWWKHIISISGSQQSNIFLKEVVDENEFKNEIGKQAQHDVIFLGENFFNLPKTPKRTAPIGVNQPVLFPVVNQFVYSLKDDYNKLQERANYLINSAKEMVAIIEKDGGNSTKLKPTRVYTLLSPFQSSNNLLLKVDGRYLFDSIDKRDVTTNIKEGEQIYAVSDGYWCFLKGLAEGKYKIKMYAEMLDGYAEEEIFYAQADIILDVK